MTKKTDNPLANLSIIRWKTLLFDKHVLNVEWIFSVANYAIYDIRLQILIPTQQSHRRSPQRVHG
jgi:hypothetical protein